MRVIQHETRRPAYLRLYERLKGQIIGGVYNPGQRLPSKRALADEAGVSIVTAQHALDLLCQEGYAVARERSGIYAALSTDGGMYAGPARSALPSAAPPAAPNTRAKSRPRVIQRPVCFFLAGFCGFAGSGALGGALVVRGWAP